MVIYIAMMAYTIELTLTQPITRVYNSYDAWNKPHTKPYIASLNKTRPKPYDLGPY